MDYQSLWAEIQANPACAPYIHTNDMEKLPTPEVQAKDQAIADILNVGRVRLVDNLIGEGSITEALGVPAGSVFIYNLQLAAHQALPAEPTAEDVARKAMIEQAWRLIDKAHLNVGSPAVRAGMDAFVAFGLLTSEQAAAIKRLAEVPVRLTLADISKAVRGPRGV